MSPLRRHKFPCSPRTCPWLAHNWLTSKQQMLLTCSPSNRVHGRDRLVQPIHSFPSHITRFYISLNIRGLLIFRVFPPGLVLIFPFLLLGLVLSHLFFHQVDHLKGHLPLETHPHFSILLLQVCSADFCASISTRWRATSFVRRSLVCRQRYPSTSVDPEVSKEKTVMGRG